jgi:hypothetical protein
MYNMTERRPVCEIVKKSVKILATKRTIVVVMDISE